MKMSAGPRVVARACRLAMLFAFSSGRELDSERVRRIEDEAKSYQQLVRYGPMVGRWCVRCNEDRGCLSTLVHIDS